MADIKLPREVVEAAARAVYIAWCDFHGVLATSMPWEEVHDEERQACFAEAEAALRAGLKAWPGATRDPAFEAGGMQFTEALILPLPQEAGDE